MKRFIVALTIVLMLSMVGCASDTPWRKASVETFELVGVTLGSAPGTCEILRSQNIINDEQLMKLKGMYVKAKASYAAAGAALKLAGKAATAAERDNKLAEFSKLLADVSALAQQIYDLVNTFKKVSMNDVWGDIRTGGESCLQM